MNANATNDEFAPAHDDQNLATWNRQRTIEELRNFVNTKHALLPEGIDIE